MVFSSIPAYLDPANWQQQPTHHHLTGSGGNNNNNNSHLLQPPPPAPPLSEPQSGGSTGSIRPGSMADRARMANIPMPEAALKCPRCDSTNTKFCYFNNYSLSQPRHFCKTCRRYWTRGGALRNVPVGGGCRRNKRSKGSGGTSSKSPASSSDRPTGSAGSSGANIPSNSSIGGTADMMGASGMSSQLPPLRFMTPFTDHHFTGATDMGLSYGLNYGGVGDHLNFQIGTSTGSLLSGGGLDHQQQQWARFQQQTPSFPFLAGGSGSLDMTSSAAAAGGLFESSGGVVEAVSGYQARPMRPSTGIISNSQMAPVKMEDHHYQQRQQQQQQQQQELNFSRQFLGINNNPGGSHDHQNHNQYWINGGVSSGAWTDLSGFSSTTSTTTNHHPL